MNTFETYEETAKLLAQSIEDDQFSPEAIPKIIMDFRSELDQCVDLEMMSPRQSEELFGLVRSSCRGSLA